jgi:cytochrome bd-type quinol oxidase subunit 2
MFWIRSRSEGILERSYVLGFIPEDTWIAVRPLVFKNTSTGELAIFKEDGQGTVQYLSFSDEPNSFIKQPWYSGQIFQFVILAFSLLTFLLTLIAALVGFFISLRKQAAGRHSSWQERLARGAVLALCLAFIIFVAIFTQYMGNENQSIIIFLAWLIAALALSVLLLSAAAWWKSWWSLWGRLHYSTVALAGAAITWFLAYWSVLIQP